MEECGHEVLVANARKPRLIHSNKQKTDLILCTESPKRAGSPGVRIEA